MFLQVVDRLDQRSTRQHGPGSRRILAGFQVSKQGYGGVESGKREPEEFGCCLVGRNAESPGASGDRQFDDQAKLTVAPGVAQTEVPG